MTKQTATARPQEPGARIEIALAEAYGDGRITLEEAAFPWAMEYPDIHLQAFEFYDTLPVAVRLTILAVPT